jgi:hypothetical protein
VVLKHNIQCTPQDEVKASCEVKGGAANTEFGSMNFNELWTLDSTLLTFYLSYIFLKHFDSFPKCQNTIDLKHLCWFCSYLKFDYNFRERSGILKVCTRLKRVCIHDVFKDEYFLHHLCLPCFKPKLIAAKKSSIFPKQRLLYPTPEDEIGGYNFWSLARWL